MIAGIYDVPYLPQPCACRTGSTQATANQQTHRPLAGKPMAMSAKAGAGEPNSDASLQRAGPQNARLSGLVSINWARSLRKAAAWAP